MMVKFNVVNKNNFTFDAVLYKMKLTKVTMYTVF